VRYHRWSTVLEHVQKISLPELTPYSLSRRALLCGLPLSELSLAGLSLDSHLLSSHFLGAFRSTRLDGRDGMDTRTCGKHTA
jgi:hypothetical protein